MSVEDRSEHVQGFATEAAADAAEMGVDGQRASRLDKAIMGGPPQRTGRFEYRYDTDTWTWSDTVAPIHRYHPDQIVPTTELVLSHKHPDDLAQVRALLSQSSAPFSSRHRIITTSGETRRVVGPIVMATLAVFSVVTSHPAAADPPAFPDVGQFVETDPGQFIRPSSYPERWANGYLFFRTTDGISCAIGGSSWCTGDFPGRSDRAGKCDNVQNDRGDATQPFVFGATDDACVPSSDPILSVGQKVTNAAFGITCVAGQDRLTACIDTRNGHGFVLQPSGSWVF